VVDLFRHKSYCLTASQAKIKFVLSFFMKESEHDLGYFVAHCALLCNSLERGVLQSHLVFHLFKDKGLIVGEFSSYVWQSGWLSFIQPLMICLIFLFIKNQIAA